MAGPMRYDLISFDLDGTLVDTADEIAEAANRALESNGLARRPMAEITMLIGAGTRELMRKLLAHLIHDEPALAESLDAAAVLASMDTHYAETTGTSAQPYPGCVDTLVRLKAAGIRLACTTNKELHHAKRVLEVTGLDHFFDLVIGGDSLPQKKPDASVLQHVMAVLKSDARRTAHVGDSAIDVMAAKNAGVAAWAVPYGYNAGVPVADSKPDQLFHALPEVADFALAPAESTPARAA